MKEWRIQTHSLQFTTGMVVCFQSGFLLDALNFLSCNTGDSVAKFASVNIHKRLVAEDAYREKRYKEALKMAFLGTDQDFLAS